MHRRVPLRTVAFAAVLACLAPAAVSCGTATGDGSVIKVGTIAPLSGASAGAGGEIERGVELAEQAVNDSGILGDRRLDVVVQDDQTNPTTAVNATTGLYGRGVRFFAGGTGSGPNQAVLNTLSRYDDVLSIGCGCSTTDIENEYGRESWTFFTHPWVYHYQDTAVGFLESLSPKVRTVALLYSTNPYGQEQAKYARAELKRNGKLRVVAEQEFDQEGTDLTPALTNIKRAKPDVLYILGYTNDSILATRQAKSLGVGSKLTFGTLQMGTTEFQQALGPDADDVAFIEVWAPSTHYPASKKYPDLFPATTTWTSMYEKRFHRSPNAFSLVTGYIPVVALAIAIAETGSLDRDVLARYLGEQLSTETPLGPLRFKQSKVARHHAFSSMGVYQWRNGKKVYVLPGKAGSTPVKLGD